MKNFASTRIVCALGVGVLLSICCGCGWSSPQSRTNTRTGVSESGYPGSGAADPGSPALESMRRPEKKGTSEKPVKTEAGSPAAMKAEPKPVGQK